MVSHSRMGHASGENRTNKAERVGASHGLRQLHVFSAAALLRTHDLDGRGLSAYCDEGFLTVPHSPDLVLSHLPFFLSLVFLFAFSFRFGLQWVDSRSSRVFVADARLALPYRERRLLSI